MKPRELVELLERELFESEDHFITWEQVNPVDLKRYHATALHLVLNGWTKQ